jgi:hypothetical protein
VRDKMLSIRSDLNKIMTLTHPCRCPSCENGCNFGSGALADGDLSKISEHLGLSEEEAKKQYFEEVEKFNTKRFRPKLEREKGKPYGKCVFYEKNIGCKIHNVKPLECKIAMGCKEYGEELILWFDLNHFLNPKDPESIRQYKIYLESGGKQMPGAELKDIADEKMLKIVENYEDLKDKRSKEDWEEILGMSDKDPKKDFKKN